MILSGKLPRKHRSGGKISLKRTNPSAARRSKGYPFFTDTRLIDPRYRNWSLYDEIVGKTWSLESTLCAMLDIG